MMKFEKRTVLTKGPHGAKMIENGKINLVDIMLVAARWGECC